MNILKKISKAYNAFESDNEITKKVSIREIEGNGFSLSIPLYVQNINHTSKEETKIDRGEL